MSTTPRATVVIACYEAGSQLQPTLESVLAQTVEEIEILLIDDGSRRDPVPDASELPDDPRIVVDRRPANGGYARVTNHALDRARGEWITFVDADDIVEPSYLEALLAEGEDAEADVVMLPLMAVRGGKELGPLPFDPPAGLSTGTEALAALIHNRIVGSQHMLWRTALGRTERDGTRPGHGDPEPLRAPDGETYSDFVLVARLFARARTVAYLSEPLYRYTISPDSTSGGLSESVWDLVGVPAIVRPTLQQTFPAAEAEELYQELERHNVTHILHKAARQQQDSALRREVTDWARSRITLGGLLALLRGGHRAEAGSWALVKLSPAAHRRALHWRDARKG
ncbi:glycosyltransferase family 2 protein [Brachybacterium sp. GCM10030267]|uniref:glycosyltransferase family 2 protein n=1 Tax=Brachybacterium sp. GCM10030267 TaxID=3273381 RepID=UPI003620EAB9